MFRKLLVGSAVGVVTLVGAAGIAAAHECTNVNKPPGAGAQIVLGPNDEIVSATVGVQKRVEKGLIDPATGEGYHGLLGIDVTGDGEADFSTYIVGPNGELPETAQFRGSPTNGIQNICVPLGFC